MIDQTDIGINRIADAPVAKLVGRLRPGRSLRREPEKNSQGSKDEDSAHRRAPLYYRMIAKRLRRVNALLGSGCADLLIRGDLLQQRPQRLGARRAEGCLEPRLGLL